MLGCMVALAQGSALAGGFYLPEIATPGSVGTAGAANPTNTLDASAAITNPAAMALLEADKAYMAGGQIMAPHFSFDSKIASGGGSDGGNAGDVAFAPGFSFARRVNDKNSIGFGLSALMGGGVDYGDDFVGRYQATAASLTGAGLTVSWGHRLDDTVSLVRISPSLGMSLGRGARPCLRRTYEFDLSENGANRRSGTITLNGTTVETFYIPVADDNLLA